MAVTLAANPDYGIDDPLVVRHWFGRAIWAIAIGALMWFINHDEYPGPSLRIVGVLALVALVCCGIAWFKIHSSREGKLRLRDQLLDSLALTGAERVLDVGCGRGLLAIGAAKRLKTGRVIGVDIWDPTELSGNSADAARQNAKSEGVAERVRFETSDARKSVYPDNHFDVVVSCRALHALEDDHGRELALREMYRVLKPGGRMLIFDTGQAKYYAQVLSRLGARDTQLSKWSFLWLLPSRSVSAQKA
jgi:arsenite methyltransferase